MCTIILHQSDPVKSSSVRLGSECHVGNECDVHVSEHYGSSEHEGGSARFTWDSCLPQKVLTV